MSEANKAIVRRLFDECLNPHQPDLYPEFYSDVVYRAPVVGELRDEEHRQFLLSIFAGCSDAHWTIEDQVAEEDRVVTRWTLIGTHTGTFTGIDAPDRQLRITGICVDRISGGKIVEEWEEWDTLGVAQQLGLFPQETGVGKPLAGNARPVSEEWDSSATI